MVRHSEWACRQETRLAYDPVQQLLSCKHVLFVVLGLTFLMNRSLVPRFQKRKTDSIPKRCTKTRPGDKSLRILYLKYALIFNTNIIWESEKRKSSLRVYFYQKTSTFLTAKKDCRRQWFWGGGNGEREEKIAVGSSPPSRYKTPMDFTPSHK